MVLFSSIKQVVEVMKQLCKEGVNPDNACKEGQVTATFGD